MSRKVTSRSTFSPVVVADDYPSYLGRPGARKVPVKLLEKRMKDEKERWNIVKHYLTFLQQKYCNKILKNLKKKVSEWKEKL